MSYQYPSEDYPIPVDQLCEYGCGQPATIYFPRPKKWCCSKHVCQCPEKKRQKAVGDAKRKKIKEKHLEQYPVINLAYIKAQYPETYNVEVPSGALRFNPITQVIEARCTHFDCKQEWYEVSMTDVGFREHALTHKLENSYVFYCSQECRDLCVMHGKTGAMIQKEIVLQQMIDWINDEEWYGAETSISERNLWRETCLKRDDYKCIRCGKDADHVHHEKAVKTHPMMVLDPDNGLSVCIKCHYDHFHERGSVCSLPNLAKKVCWTIVNGQKKTVMVNPKKKKEYKAPEGVLTI